MTTTSPATSKKQKISSRISGTHSNILNLDAFSVIYIATIMVKKEQKTSSPANIRHVPRAAKPSDVSVRAGIGKGGGVDNAYGIASLVREVGDAIWFTNENFTDDSTLSIYPQLIDAVESETWCNVLYAYNQVLPAFNTGVNDYVDDIYFDLLTETGLRGCNGHCNDNCIGAREVAIEIRRIEAPTECTSNLCQGSNRMELIHIHNFFQDKQFVKIQETPRQQRHHLYFHF